MLDIIKDGMYVAKDTHARDASQLKDGGPVYEQNLYWSNVQQLLQGFTDETLQTHMHAFFVSISGEAVLPQLHEIPGMRIEMKTKPGMEELLKRLHISASKQCAPHFFHTDPREFFESSLEWAKPVPRESSLVLRLHASA